jgi:hypothetical protein
MTLRDIRKEVCREHGVHPRDFLSSFRDGNLVNARTEFVRRAIESGYGCAAIGRAMNRDRTTVEWHKTRAPRRYQYMTDHAVLPSGMASSGGDSIESSPPSPLVAAE